MITALSARIAAERSSRSDIRRETIALFASGLSMWTKTPAIAPANAEVSLSQ